MEYPTKDKYSFEDIPMEMRKFLDIVAEATDDDLDAEFSRELERSQQLGVDADTKLQQLQQKLNDLIPVYRQVQKITSQMKHNEQLMSVLTDVSRLAADNGISGESYSYQESTILEKARELEEAVYGLDELFKDAIDNIKYEIERIEEEL